MGGTHVCRIIKGEKTSFERWQLLRDKRQCFFPSRHQQIVAEHETLISSEKIFVETAHRAGSADGELFTRRKIGGSNREHSTGKKLPAALKSEKALQSKIRITIGGFGAKTRAVSEVETARIKCLVGISRINSTGTSEKIRA